MIERLVRSRLPGQLARMRLAWGMTYAPPKDRVEFNRRRTTMIELVLTICALVAPDKCDETRLQFVSQGSLMQCMMQAPPYIAAWSETHPAERVASWRCAYPGARGDKI